MLNAFLILLMLSLLPVPTSRSEQVSIIEIYANQADAFYALDDSGTLWRWRENEEPTALIRGVREFHSDGVHQCIVSIDDELWTWHSDEGVDTRRMLLSEMESIVAPNMAIAKDGSLWTWGDNEFGQLGNGTTERQADPQRIIEDVVKASGDGLSSMALKRDGSLWAWGYNATESLVKAAEAVIVEPRKALDGVVDMYCGRDQSLWLTAERVLYYRGGRNQDDIQLFEDVTAFYPLSSPQQGRVVTRDAELWSWGDSFIGDGDIESDGLPIKLLDHAVSIEEKNIVIDQDNNLWAWQEGSIHGKPSVLYEGMVTSITKLQSNIAEARSGNNVTLLLTTDGRVLEWKWHYQVGGVARLYPTGTVRELKFNS